MSKIHNEEWSDDLAKGLMQDFAEMQDAILSRVAQRLEDMRELTESELYKMSADYATSYTINDDIDYIRREISKGNRKFGFRIARIFDKAEKDIFADARRYFEYRNIKISDIMQRADTLQLVKAIRKETLNGLLNISHTYAYDYDGEVNEIGKAYRKIVNKAVESVASGSVSIDKAISQAVNKLAESGIKTLEWDSESGKAIVRRADFHIRMNIDEGINRLNESLQKHNAAIFGADGVQVSMHALCAPDHQPIQGNQYSLKEYDAIDSSLARPIGTLNCKHFISYCILSVSPPLYSKEEIEEAKNRSNAVVSYNGKEYTRYEASQKMRAREREIRKTRSVYNAMKKSGDTALRNQAQMKLNAQLNNYKNFCNQVGLTPIMSRTRYVI